MSVQLRVRVGWLVFQNASSYQTTSLLKSVLSRILTCACNPKEGDPTLPQLSFSEKFSKEGSDSYIKPENSDLARKTRISPSIRLELRNLD